MTFIAKADGAATDDQMRIMTQASWRIDSTSSFIADQKEMTVMALMLGKSGSKLKASHDQGEGGFEPLNGKPIIRFRRVTMGDFAERLAQIFHKPVVNQTGLNGIFDFTLDATKYSPPPPS